MAFAGYLLKSGNDIFPNKFIEMDTWSTTPDQREEIKAYRDDNTRNLTRITAAGRKTVITFKTPSNLHLAEKTQLINFFTSHETNHTERKVPLTFWNDETGTYDSGYFYRPNMQFPIIRISGNDIVYGQLQIDLIEY